MRLKEGSTWEAYGPEWKMMYDRVGDIGNLDSKIQQIIQTLNTNYRERIIKAKNTWLKNNESDQVIVDIIADGQEGEQSGGLVKGDIMVKINMNGENIIDETVELKSYDDISYRAKNLDNTHTCVTQQCADSARVTPPVFPHAPVRSWIHAIHYV